MDIKDLEKNRNEEPITADMLSEDTKVEIESSATTSEDIASVETDIPMQQATQQLHAQALDANVHLENPADIYTISPQQTAQTVQMNTNESKASKQARFNWRDLVVAIGYLPVQFIVSFIAIFIVMMGVGVSGGDAALVQASSIGLFFSGFVSFVFIVIAYKDFFVAQMKGFGKHVGRNIGIIFGTYAATLIFRMVFTIFVSEDTAGNQEIIESMFLNANIIQYLTLFGPLVLFAPFVEEMLTRKIIIGNTFRKNNAALTWSMVLVSGIVFGLLHFSGASSVTQLLLLIPYMAMGWILGAAYAYTKNIFVPIFGHLLNNLVAVILLIIIL